MFVGICASYDTYSLLGGLVLAAASNLVDFLLHSIILINFCCFFVTNVDFESTHVFAIEVVSGILGIAIIVILNESVGTLLEIREGVRYL